MPKPPPDPAAVVARAKVLFAEIKAEADAALIPAVDLLLASEDAAVAHLARAVLGHVRGLQAIADEATSDRLERYAAGGPDA